MSPERMNPELMAVEAALASLSPAPSGVDRDRLMFLAGTASAGRSRAHWTWPAATAATTLLAVWLGAMLAVRPAAPLGGPIAGDQPGPAGETSSPVQRAMAVGDDAEPIRADYLVLRRKVLSEGVDALPPFSAFPIEKGPTLRFGSGRGDSMDGLFDG